MFYAIVDVGVAYEYHISHVKLSVATLGAMSKQLPKSRVNDSNDAAAAILEWHAMAVDTYRAKPVIPYVDAIRRREVIVRSQLEGRGEL